MEQHIRIQRQAGHVDDGLTDDVDVHQGFNFDIAVGLQDLSGRLQVAVEDVPKGRRFEADLRDVENGRPSVNQPI